MSVRASHILKKHEGSRRPASWRNPRITQSVIVILKFLSSYDPPFFPPCQKSDAISQIEKIRADLVQILESNGAEALQDAFADIARVESDCGSAERGGDLGHFGRGL
jgi:peptidyl-prolyl cis-trans isomerase NIMA-interacting 1